MGHKAFIGGTAYEVIGGTGLISGAGYGIKAGKTMIGGTVYDIPFQNGTPVSDLAVGSSVYLNVDSVATEFMVVHHGNPDTSLYDASCDGTWLLAKDIYTNMIFGSQYAGGNSYADSDIHSYLNSTFLGLLDTNIQNSIKQVKIPYSDASKSIKTGANGLSAKVFLLSDAEVGFTASASQSLHIGARLSYFPSGDNVKAIRIAYSGGTASYWWTRCPNALSSAYVIRVNKTGAFANAGSCDGGQHGVRPALILSSDICVDENFNVIAA